MVGRIIYNMEDVEKMKEMTKEEAMEYKRQLIIEGRYTTADYSPREVCVSEDVGLNVTPGWIDTLKENEILSSDAVIPEDILMELLPLHWSISVQ